MKEIIIKIMLEDRVHKDKLLQLLDLELIIQKRKKVLILCNKIVTWNVE